MSRLRHIAAVLLCACVCLSAGAQNAQKNKKARLEREIRALEEQLRTNAARSSNAVSKATLLHQKVGARRELLVESDRELRALSDTIRLTEEAISREQARLDTMTVMYGRLVRNAYRNRDSRLWYIYILSSDDLGQATRRFGYLRSLSAQMNTQARRIQDAKADLELRRDDLGQLYRRARELRDARAYELGKLQKEENESMLLIKQLQKDKNKYQKQIADKRRQVEALNKEIERMIAAAMNDKGSTAKAKKPVDQKLSSQFAENEGKLPWPVSGAVVGRFGQHPHPVYRTVMLPFNNGINIAVSGDANVKAVFDGVVKQIIVMPGYNQCVLVQHGEYFTFYCKLGTVGVKAGDKVKTGQVIGRVANMGDETQLHFQLWKGKAPQDPEEWLR